MKLVMMTAPNGAHVFVNPELVSVVADSVGNTNAMTTIFHASGQIHVREPKELAKDMLTK